MFSFKKITTQKSENFLYENIENFVQLFQYRYNGKKNQKVPVLKLKVN